MKSIISFNKIKKSFLLIISTFLILANSVSYCPPQFGKKMPMGDDFESVVKDVEAAMKKMDPAKVARMDQIFKDAMSGKQPSPSEMAELDQIGKELNDKIQEIKTERGGGAPQPSIEPESTPPPFVEPSEIPESARPSIIEKPHPVTPPSKKPLPKKEIERLERTLNSLMQSCTSLRQKISSVRDVRKKLNQWQMALDVIIMSLATLEGKPKQYKNDLLVKENLSLLNELNKFNTILSQQEPLVPAVDSFGCEQDYYLILGIQSDATPEEVDAAYQKLIDENSEEALEKKFSQTKFLSKEEIKEAVKNKLEKFSLLKPDIDEAYETLKDPEARNLYDLQRETLACPSPASQNSISVINQLFGQEANFLITQLDNFFRKFKQLELKETEEMKKQDLERQKKLEAYRKQQTYIYPTVISEYQPYGGWRPSYEDRGYGGRQNYEPGFVGPRPPLKSGQDGTGFPKSDGGGKSGGGRTPGSNGKTGETGTGTSGTTPQTSGGKPKTPQTAKETPLETLARNLDEFNQQFDNQGLGAVKLLPAEQLQNFSEQISDNINKLVQNTTTPVKKISETGTNIYKDLDKELARKKGTPLKESLEKIKAKREGFVANINTLRQMKVPDIDPKTGQPIVIDHGVKTAPLVKEELIKPLIEAKQIVEKINQTINPPPSKENQKYSQGPAVKSTPQPTIKTQSNQKPKAIEEIDLRN